MIIANFFISELCIQRTTILPVFDMIIRVWQVDKYQEKYRTDKEQNLRIHIFARLTLSFFLRLCAAHSST
jgi:hypothetical protein